MKINTLINKEPGYAICSIENMKIFKKLRDSFLKNLKIPHKYKKNINNARVQIAKMSKAEINRSMINFLTFNKNLSEMMINSCPKLIKDLCGKDLFIQRRAHTTINVPGNEHTNSGHITK